MKLKSAIRYVLLILSVICISIYLISRQWEIQVGFERFALYLYPNENNRNAELFKILLTVIGGMGVFYSLHLAYRRAKATDKSLILQSQAINKQSEQLELSRKGQVDERFKNAIEHLGNDKEPIILGGIVELHQIAREDQLAYSAVVFNILTSYLRTVLKVDVPREDNFSHTIPQTIIDFLFRGDDSALYRKCKANLSYCNFNSLDINDCKFIDSDFSFSLMPMYVRNVNFENSKFSRTNFTISRISDSNFRNTDMHNNLFQLCEFKNVDFWKSKMYSQLFINAKIYDCQFFNANLYNSRFLLCHLENSYFSHADLLNTNFLGCNFTNIDFSENKTISKIDFTGSGFYEVTFGSQCFECNFSGARQIFQFDYIQPKDLELLIGKKNNIAGIKELPGNHFLSCQWDDFTKADFDKINSEFNNARTEWTEKYGSLKKTIKSRTTKNKLK